MSSAIFLTNRLVTDAAARPPGAGRAGGRTRRHRGCRRRRGHFPPGRGPRALAKEGAPPPEAPMHRRMIRSRAHRDGAVQVDCSGNENACNGIVMSYESCGPKLSPLMIISRTLCLPPPRAFARSCCVDVRAASARRRSWRAPGGHDESAVDSSRVEIHIVSAAQAAGSLHQC